MPFYIRDLSILEFLSLESIRPNSLWILRDSCAYNGLEVEQMLVEHSKDQLFQSIGYKRKKSLCDQNRRIKQKVLLDFSHSSEETMR